MNIKNTEQLRQMLLETIGEVKNGKVDPNNARAVATLAGKILQSARLDLEVLKYNSHEGHTVKAGEKPLQLVSA